eukprot:UN4012
MHALWALPNSGPQLGMCVWRSVPSAIAQLGAMLTLIRASVGRGVGRCALCVCVCVCVCVCARSGQANFPPTSPVGMLMHRFPKWVSVCELRWAATAVLIIPTGWVLRRVLHCTGSVGTLQTFIHCSWAVLR